MTIRHRPKSWRTWSRMIWVALTITLLSYTWRQNGPTWLFGTLSGWALQGLTWAGGTLPWWWRFVTSRFRHLRLAVEESAPSWVLRWGEMAFFLMMAAIPPERLPWGIRERQEILIPVWLWLAAGSGLWLTNHKEWEFFVRRAQAVTLRKIAAGGKTWLFVITPLTAGIVAIAITGWGVRARWPLNWQGYPAPLLSQHLLTALLLLGGTWWLAEGRQAEDKRHKWWLIPWVLWGLAVVLWWQTEPTENHFLSLPLLPNNEPYYPASDAAIYFFQMLQGKLGWGYGGWHWIGTPFLRRYGMLTILHLTSRETLSYPLFIFAWVAILALSVALIYVVGKRLHSRSLGLLLALALIGRETVAMRAARQLAVVHVKNLMSEPLLRLFFLTLVAVLVTRPSNKPRAKLQYGLLLGALAGWGVLVRVESLMPASVVIGGYGLWALLHPRRKHWLGFGAALVGLFLVWAPWMWRSALLSRQIYTPKSIYYNSPWFFLPALQGASSPEYRYIVPSPTPTPKRPSSSPAYRETPPNTSTLHPSPISGTAIFIIQATPTPTPPLTTTSLPVFSPTAMPTATPPLTLTFTPVPTPTTTPPPFLPVNRLPTHLRQPLLHTPILGSLLRWWGITWQQWWAYIGRNVVTSWTAWPWSPRFYTPLQAVDHRPLASHHPLKTHHFVILVFNLAIWALGWVAIWRRSRWTAIAPWGVYGAYVIALAFGRTGGGRYIVPLDWIPLMYYLAGWLVLMQTLWQSWGLEVPKKWWTERHPTTLFARPTGWGKGMLALALVFLSATGVGLERYAVARADQHPEWTPPRRRVATFQDITKQITSWGAWPATGITSEEFRARLKGQKWQAVWGRVYFPRFLPAGERGGEWIYHERFEQDSLFTALLSSRGVTHLALSPPQPPGKIPLGAEAVALVCPQRFYDTAHLFATTSLFVVRRPNGTIWAYAAPKEEWHCP